MYDLKDIKSVQIEITERCNAACPACTRNYFGYSSIPGIYKGNMTLEQFKILLPEEFIQQLDDVSFCGNLGDAQMNPYLPDIVDYLHNANSDMHIAINTNGSMHNEEYWANFAKYKSNASSASGDRISWRGAIVIIFGIDGTTNEVHSFYRRNTDYNKVINNARAFINAGGVATWQFILFKHNEYQLEDAKKLAKEYKFRDIYVIKSDRPNNTPVFDNKRNYVGQLEDSTIDEIGYLKFTKNLKENNTVEGVDGNYLNINQEVQFGKLINEKYLNNDKSWENDIKEPWVQGYLGGYADIKSNFDNIDINHILRGGNTRFEENRKIECMATRESRIFITADGYVYPCCMMGLNHTRVANEYTYDTREIIKYAGMPNDVNDALKHGSIQAVFDSGFMELIKQTWIPDTTENNFVKTMNAPYGSKNGNLHICASSCSNCNIN